MHKLLLLTVAVLSALLGALAVSVPPVRAQSQYQSAMFVNPEKFRFRLIGQEPIATPDAKGTVPGWSVIVLKDVRSGQCHTAFLAGAAMSVSPPGVCPID